MNELLNKHPKDINAFGFIYKITNLINQKIYIGQTTKSVRERFKKHCGEGQIMYICSAIKKYGKDNFSIEVLAICSNETLLNKYEQICINRYKSQDHKIGYNITSGGDHWTFTEESKLKMKITNTKKYGIPVIVFDLINKTNKEYPSISEAARCNSIFKSGFTRIINKLEYSYKNFKIMSKEFYLTQNIDNIWSQFDLPATSIKFEVLNKKTNELLIFKSVASASKILKISSSAILRRLTRPLKHTKFNTKNFNHLVFRRI